MGWGFGIGHSLFQRYPVLEEEPNSRPLGYNVAATCDKRGCHAQIDRGLGYVCGEMHHDEWSDEPGCGRYFCEKHGSYVGPRGGCDHHGKWAWGKTLACMVQSKDAIYCLFRPGHEEPHAWSAPDPNDRRLGYHDAFLSKKPDDLGRPKCYCGTAMAYHPVFGAICRPEHYYHASPHRGCILR